MGSLKTEVMGKIATLLGYDGYDFRAVKVDGAGKLQVDIAAITGASGFATSAKQDTLNNKFTGQPFTYTGTVILRYGQTVAASGNDTINSDVVPAGVIWIITAIGAFCTSAVVSLAQLSAHISGVNCTLGQKVTLGASELLGYTGWIVLSPGDKLILFLMGTTPGATSVLSFSGFSMGIAP